MLFLILLGITLLVTILVGILRATSRYGDWYDVFSSVVSTLIPGVLVSLLVSGMVLLGARVPMDDQKVEYPLQALGISDPQISGSFFLASGSFKDEQRIQFFRQNPDGGAVLRYVTPDEASIFQDDPAQPYVAYVYHQYAHPTWVVPWPVGTYTAGGTSYEFHIPSGSVVNTYELDLSK